MKLKVNKYVNIESINGAVEKFTLFRLFYPRTYSSSPFSRLFETFYISDSVISGKNALKLVKWPRAKFKSNIF